MELFRRAKAIRLRSQHDKYLHADDDEESVIQNRNGSSTTARWSVELIHQGGDSYVRLKSCFNKYLTASSIPFLLGMTGRKVLQTLPKRLDSSLEWEPITDTDSGKGSIKLKTRYGQYLRANGGVPPWRNSVTHDLPQRGSSAQEWLLWDVDLLEIQVQVDKVEPVPVVQPQSLHRHLQHTPSQPPFHSYTSSSNLQSSESIVSSLHKAMDGRIIYYEIANHLGAVDDAIEKASFNFNGNGIDELKSNLEHLTGLVDIIVCARSPLNGKLYPLQLRLPPNHGSIQVVVVPRSSKDLLLASSTS